MLYSAKFLQEVYMLTDGFSKVTPLADAYLLDEKTIHVYSKHALIQAIGYLKYILAKEHHMGMAMRGQRKLYGSLTPSLFHSIKNKSAAVNAKTELQNLLQRAKDNYTEVLCKNPQERYPETFCKYLSISEYDLEPLLQHYGISTTWLDLVDNIWVALWFACHKACRSSGDFGNFSIYEKRNPFKESIENYDDYLKNKDKIENQIKELKCEVEKLKNAGTAGSNNSFMLKNKILDGAQKNKIHSELNSAYCYIILVRTPLQIETTPSDYKDETLLDLRSKYPSLFLRPHAQHGLLLRKNKHIFNDDWDYSDWIEGIIRMDLTSAVEWLGASDTLSSSMLMPSPVKDLGMQKLLRSEVLRSKIEIITP